jgi:hypothetical protein
MKKPKVKGVMEFITVSMGKPKGKMRRMSEDGERPAALDLSELLSKMGFPPMMGGMGPRAMHGEPEDMEDEMEDEGEEEMPEEEDNKDLDTLELIKKLMKRLDELSTRMSMGEYDKPRRK